MKKFVYTLVTLLLIALMLPLSVSAISAPDSINVINKGVFRNLIETDDRLFVIQYDLQYAVYPTDYSVNSTFIFSLYDTDGTTLLGSSLAYPYWRESVGDASGYGQGVVSFYFPATPLIDWGEAYILRIQGNPLVFGTPPSQSFVFGSSDYTTLTSSDDNQLSLGNYIETIAGDLETAWSTTLLDSQEGTIVLSSYGEEYFTNAILGLRLLAPSLYYVQEVSQDLTRRTWTTGYADALSAGTVDTEGTTIDGSFIETGLDAGGDLLGVPKQIFGSILTGIVIVIVMMLTSKNLASSWMGWVFSSLVLVGGVRLSMVNMAVVAIWGLFSIIFIFWTIFGSKS